MKKSASTFLHEHSPNKSAMYNESWIIEAMKSYAKQWIDSASIVGRMYGGINIQKAIENLKSQIDNQNEA